MQRNTLIWTICLSVACGLCAAGQDAEVGVEISGEESGRGAENGDGGISIGADLETEPLKDESSSTVTNTTAESPRAFPSQEGQADWGERLNLDDGSTSKQKIDKLQEEAAHQNRIGNTEGALDIYEQILELEPDLMPVQFTRANLLLKLERYEEALEILKRLREKEPENYYFHNNMAWIYATAKDINLRNGKKAKSLAREALLFGPNDHHVWNTLSEAYFISAEYEKAAETARIAFHIANSKGNPQEKLKELAAQVRKCEQASKTMSIIE